MKPTLKTPLLFIIFNRPEETKRVFDILKYTKPEKLFIAADGARTDKNGEKELCEAARKITENIDWSCEVKRLYQDRNLGCKIGVITAIDWFFSQVPEGIILEDDCAPNTSFFTFCENMLEKYREDRNIMAINGTCFLNKKEISDNKDSYHFSHCLHVWGWASFSRAWQKNDLEMKDLDTLDQLPFAKSLFSKEKYLNFWIKHFKHIRDKKVDTWDAQWHYSILANNGIVISPHTNMIENIGFGANATHTFLGNPHIIPTEEMIGGIKNPKEIKVDTELDSRIMDKLYIKNIIQRIVSKIKR